MEPGSYILHKGDVEVTTGTGGSGTVGAMAGGLFGDESIFLNTFEAKGGGAEIWVAPPKPGDIAAQDTSYLAHAGDIKLSVGWRELKGLIAKREFLVCVQTCTLPTLAQLTSKFLSDDDDDD